MTYQSMTFDRLPSRSAVRAQSFGRSAVRLQAPLGQFLTDEIIMQRAPSVFAQEAHSSRSSKYEFHSTRELLGNMRGAGFFPVVVQQAGSKDSSKLGYTKHLIRFRREQPKNVGDSVQEIVTVGSHDGTSSTIIMAGWFRLACLNGLVVADRNRERTEVRVQHFVRNGWDKVIDGSFTVIEDGDRQADAIERMKAKALTFAQQMEFADHAMTIRYGDERPNLALDRLLAARRVEDRGDSVWLTMNRVQENLMHGGLGYIGEREMNGRLRRVRAHTNPIRGIDSNISVNRALWKMAEDLVAA
jgi:hypothetical protein